MFKGHLARNALPIATNALPQDVRLVPLAMAYIQVAVVSNVHPSVLIAQEMTLPFARDVLRDSTQKEVNAKLAFRAVYNAILQLIALNANLIPILVQIQGLAALSANGLVFPVHLIRITNSNVPSANLDIRLLIMYAKPMLHVIPVHLVLTALINILLKMGGAKNANQLTLNAQSAILMIRPPVQTAFLALPWKMTSVCPVQKAVSNAYPLNTASNAKRAILS